MLKPNCFRARTSTNDNTSKVTGRCRNNPNWTCWGMEKSCCKQNGEMFSDHLTWCCQNESQNVSTASGTARDITSVPVDTCLGAVVGYSVNSPKGCCSCTPFCVLLKVDFSLRDPESAQCELDGRICQQVH